MAVHSGMIFSALNGDLLISVLKFKEVRWMQLDGMKVIAQYSLFKELPQRIRDVRVHKYGSLYLLTDSSRVRLFGSCKSSAVIL
jgi:glucose/arabinose dehydrogenase